MGLFSNYAKEVNRNIGKAFSTEKAKKIRKNFIAWGIVLTIIAVIALVIGFVIMFNPISDVIKDAGNYEVEPINIVGHTFAGFEIIFVGAFVLMIGITMLRAGLMIVVVDAGSILLDIDQKCPKCGDPIDEDEQFCGKCGTPLKVNTKCASCGTQNEVNDKFCRNCGKEL